MTSTLFLIALVIVILLTAYLGWPGRSQNRVRQQWSLWMRVVILIAILAALLGASIKRKSDQLAVVFLLDVSDSVSPQSTEYWMGYIEQSTQGKGAAPAKGADDLSSLVVFGEQSIVEKVMSNSPFAGVIHARPGTTQTDLEAAIRLGLALYPDGAARRMVILSDGAETRGDASAAARLAIERGVDLLFLPAREADRQEVWLSGVDSPAQVLTGEDFSLIASINADKPTQARVRIISASQTVYQGEIDLRRGAHAYQLPLHAGEPGFAEYRVQVVPEIDGDYQNNEMGAFTRVLGPPKVLVVAPPAGEELHNGETRPDEAGHLVNALQAAGIQVEQVIPSQFPADVVALGEYPAVILIDVPARQLQQGQMAAIQSYVRDLGGGLVVVGGLTSFGVGGYFQTPLEEALPIEMQIRDAQRMPALSIVYIIDRSGSMADISGGAEKLEIAKEAVIRSIDMLAPGDRSGVIAFDETASWVVPLSGVEEKAAIQNAVASLRPGGGTDILAGIQAMAGSLPGDPAEIKHAVLLTDGGADPSGIPELVSSLYRSSGITLSTIGIGSDAAPYLEELAELGGGRFYWAAVASEIPQIFTEETGLVSRAYLVEHDFVPEVNASSPVLTGLEELPVLRGYVAATVKQMAQTILVSDLGDPVLASWQYGLGKSAAFTSDASGRWASSWLGWEGFPRFWVQLLRSVLVIGGQSSLSIDFKPVGETIKISVDAISDPGQGFINGYTVSAVVTGPDGESSEIPLPQIAPGRYENSFVPRDNGVYLAAIHGTRPGEPDLTGSSAYVQNYSAEYIPVNEDAAGLARLMEIVKGRAAPERPGDVFRHDLPALRTTQPIWRLLLALAVLLLPVDIAIRRLQISKEDVIRWLKKLFPGSRRDQPIPQGGPPEVIVSLTRAKRRAKAVTTSPRERRTGEEGDIPQTRDDLMEEELPVDTTDGASASQPGEAPKDLDKDSGHPATRLLERKRQRRK